MWARPAWTGSAETPGALLHPVRPDGHPDAGSGREAAEPGAQVARPVRVLLTGDGGVCTPLERTSESRSLRDIEGRLDKGAITHRRLDPGLP